MSGLAGVLPVHSKSTSGVRRRPAPSRKVQSDAGSALPDDWFNAALNGEVAPPVGAGAGGEQVPDLLTGAIGDLQLVQRVQKALDAMNSAGVSSARVAVALTELAGAIADGSTSKTADVEAFEATAAREIASLAGPPLPPPVPVDPGEVVPPVPAPGAPVVPFWTPLKTGLAIAGGTVTVGAIVAAIVYYAGKKGK